MATRPKTPDATLPWTRPPFDKPAAFAIKALADGTATKDQQVRALNWIVHIAAGTYDLPWRPDDKGGARGTDLACGRMLVGQAIVYLINMPVDKLRKEPGEDG